MARFHSKNFRKHSPARFGTTDIPTPWQVRLGCFRRSLKSLDIRYHAASVGLPALVYLGPQARAIELAHFPHSLVAEGRQVRCTRVVFHLRRPLAARNGAGDGVEHENPA